MKRKGVRVAIIASIIKIGIVVSIAIGTFLLWYFAPWLKPILLERYSNDSIYEKMSGSIEEAHHYTSNTYLSFIWAKNELGEYYDVGKLGLNNKYLTIYSPCIDKTWDLLNPKKEKEIDFIYAPGYKYANFNSVIVQISLNGEEILSFLDGKQALIDYINSNYT